MESFPRKILEFLVYYQDHSKLSYNDTNDLFQIKYACSSENTALRKYSCSGIISLANGKFLFKKLLWAIKTANFWGSDAFFCNLRKQLAENAKKSYHVHKMIVVLHIYK